MIRLQEDVGDWILSSNNYFMIKFAEVERSSNKSCDVCVSILHMDVVIGWDSNDIV